MCNSKAHSVLVVSEELTMTCLSLLLMLHCHRDCAPAADEGHAGVSPQPSASPALAAAVLPCNLIAACHLHRSGATVDC